MTMAQYITTHNDSGESVYSTKVPTEPHAHTFPGGKMEMIFSSHNFPTDLSSEADVEQFSQDRTNGLPGGAFVPANGSAAAIVSMEPNSSSLMHRTTSLDVMVVIEGIIECHLDSGEVKTLKPGDSIVQRGTMHQWKNITSNDGWARTAAFAVPIVQPFKIAGKTLETEYKM